MLSTCIKACPDERACPPGSADDGQILPGLPVNVVHTGELMNRRACPTMPVACEVRYDQPGAKHCQEDDFVLHDNYFVC